MDITETFEYQFECWAGHVEDCFYTSDGIGIRRAYGISYSADVRAIRARIESGTVTDDDRALVAARVEEMS